MSDDVDESDPEDKYMEQYTVESDQVTAKITIKDAGDYVPHYELKRPQPSAATEAILDEVRERTISEADISAESFEDANQVEKSREVFRKTAKEIMEEELPNMSDSKRDTLIGNLIHNMLGMGDVEILLSDNNLEEIVINDAEEPAWVYHKDYGWLKTDIYFDSEDEIYNYASEIGRGVGKNISSLHPLLDAHLPSGDRTNATLSPISTQGNTITIRKFARDPWTITDFIDIGTINPEMAAFLWLCIQYEMNVIISGGTGTGKCLTPDSKLTMADGTVKSIEDVVDRNLTDTETIDDGWKASSNEGIISMDNDYSTEKKVADKVWKREAPDQMLRIETESGRSIEATAEHPFFVNRSGALDKLRSDQITEGDYIPSPRTVNIENEDSDLSIKDWLDDKKLVITEGEKIKSVRGKEVRIPRKVDENLAEITGLIAGDGHIHTINKSSCRVELHNSNACILEHFKNISEDIFEIDTKIKNREDRVNKAQFHSYALTEFFKKFLNIPSGSKSDRITIPESIVSSSDETLAGFLRGFFEAEAHVNHKRSNIEITSKSKEIIKNTSVALKRFSIFNRLEEKELDEETYYRLVIGPECLESFQKSIGFISDAKNAALDKALETPNNSNRDIIPSEKILRELKEVGSFHDYELAERSDLSRRSISRYLDGSRNPSRDAFGNIVSVAKNRLEELKRVEKQLRELKDETSTQSRKECRDTVLNTIKSGKIERKLIEEETSISTGLISHWKTGSVPSSQKLEEATSLLKEEGIETEYTSLDYRNIFSQIKMIRKELKVTPTEIKEELGIDIGIYESSNRETNRKTVNSLINYLLEECKQSLHKLSELLPSLEKIGNSDIHWDKVKNIEKFNPETNWVYDLSVQENHTFVAEDLIAHNTSLLNVLTPFMPPNQRIISIEDTREVSLPEFLHWVPMTTREQNPDGQGEVSMQDLLVNSLRMRPDRILVGEIRRKRQAEVLFEAMQTGHSVYSTLHADTAETTVKRMTNPPIDVPETVVGAVDLNVVMFRDRRRNFRRVLEIAEVIDDEDGLHPHTLYNWKSQEDAFYKKGESNQVIDKLSRLTGMLEEEIESDIEKKTEVLNWLVEKEVTDLERVGRVIAEYYAREDDVMEKIRNMEDPESIIPDQ